jgi:hypothetical protein
MTASLDLLRQTEICKRCSSHSQISSLNEAKRSHSGESDKMYLGIICMFIYLSLMILFISVAKHMHTTAIYKRATVLCLFVYCHFCPYHVALTIPTVFCLCEPCSKRGGFA